MAKKVLEKGLDLGSKAMDLADDMTTTLDEEADFINERYAAEVASDHWLTANIRPLLIIWIMLLLTADGLDLITIKPAIAELLEVVFTLLVVFYTGGRTWEKVEKMRRKNERTTRKAKRRDK